MFNEFEHEDDQWRPDPPKALVIFKKTLWIAFCVFAFSFIGFLLLRMFTSNPPREMKNPVWNDELFSAYTKAKNEGKDLQILQIPSSNSFSEDNMFSIYTITYTPDIHQLQFTVRFNNRALNHLEEKYPEHADFIDKKNEVYSFSLTVKRGDDTEIIRSYEYIKSERFGYTFYRLIFSDVDVSTTSSVKVNTHFSLNEAVPQNTIDIYDNGVYKDLATLPPFDFSAPKKQKEGILSRENG